MENFRKFINRQKVSRGLAPLVESAEEEVPQNQQKLAQDQIKQVALQKIKQGQDLCDASEKESKEFLQGQQMIQQGHKLLQQVNDLEQEEVAVQEPAAEEAEPVNPAVQQFQNCQKDINDAVTVLATVVNDLIPPAEEITIPQLAKQTQLITRLADLSDSAVEAVQTAVDQESEILDSIDDEELKQNLVLDQSEQLVADQSPVLATAQQHIEDVIEQIQGLIDTVDGKDLEIVQNCQDLLKHVQKIKDNVQVVAQQEAMAQDTEAAAEVQKSVDDAQQKAQDKATAQLIEPLKKAQEAIVQQATLAQEQDPEGCDEFVVQCDFIATAIENAQQMVQDDCELDKFVNELNQVQDMVDNAIQLSQGLDLVKQSDDDDEEPTTLEDIKDEIQKVGQMVQDFIDSASEEQEKQEDVEEDTQQK